jgi:Mg/Co/Ni transporter MgtE
LPCYIRETLRRLGQESRLEELKTIDEKTIEEAYQGLEHQEAYRLATTAPIEKIEELLLKAKRKRRKALEAHLEEQAEVA